MSKEDALKFAQRLETDKALRAKVREASEQIHKVARENGFDFTRGELSDVLRDKWGASKLPKSKDGDDDGPSTCFVCSERPGF